jgi:HK97 family phage major capsid protein
MDDKQKEFEQQVQKTIEDALEKHVPEVVDKSVSEKMDEKINEVLKEKGLDKIEKGNFPGLGDNPKKDAKTAKEKALKFFKAVFAKDTETLKEMGIKTMTEGTDSAGGFLVPEEVLAEVDRVADDYGLIRKLSRRIPMGRDILNVPTVGTKPSVYWPGEGNAGTSSQPVLKNVKMQAHTAVGLTPVSNELMADANVGVVDMLVDLFAEELAGEEDNQGLAGVGAPFTGVLNSGEVSTSTAATGNTTVATLDLADLIDAQANVKSTVLNGAVWVFHRTVWAGLKKLQENSQSLIAFGTTQSITMKTEGSNANTPVGFLLGYPVYLSDKMPSSPSAGTAYGIFGNFKKFYFGDRQQIAVNTSEHATIGSTNMFEANSQAVRVLERISLNVGVGEAFNVCKLAAS